MTRKPADPAAALKAAKPFLRDWRKCIKSSHTWPDGTMDAYGAKELAAIDGLLAAYPALLRSIKRWAKEEGRRPC